MAIFFDFRPRLVELNKSFAWLARVSGVSRSTIRRQQARRAKGFKWTTLERLCAALQCQPGDILKLDGGS
jgi:DNA-binding Xre family transcriptional regulator